MSEFNAFKPEKREDIVFSKETIEWKGEDKWEDSLIEFKQKPIESVEPIPIKTTTPTDLDKFKPTIPEFERVSVENEQVESKSVSQTEKVSTDDQVENESSEQVEATKDQGDVESVEKVGKTPLSEETYNELKEKNYPQDIIDRIDSEEEAQIYLQANLEATEVNGKSALMKTNIDYDQVDAMGMTNLERMQKGLAPLDKEGKPIELHHIGQNSDSPLAELTRKEHTGGGNDTILHNKQKESEINRGDFQKEKIAYWKARAEQVIADREATGA